MVVVMVMAMVVVMVVVVVIVVVVTGGKVGREIRVIWKYATLNLAIPHRKFPQNSLKNYHHQQHFHLRMCYLVFILPLHAARKIGRAHV